MKERIHASFFYVLVACFVSLSWNLATAQTFKIIHNFTGGSDGANPLAGLTISANTLYGTASAQGDDGGGTAFKLKTDGSGFSVLHSFSSGVGVNPYNGNKPASVLLLSSNTLYGTAYYGGASGYGIVFAVGTDGTGFTNLHSFDHFEAYPNAGLILSAETLYGTTFGYQSLGYGSVFAVKTNGVGFTNLHAFANNSDANFPADSLVLSGSNLYGTTWEGGISGTGTIFTINTNGSGYTILHNFPPVAGLNNTNNEGATPYAPLVSSGNVLYGVAATGGSTGNGTIFSINADGSGFTKLHTISAGIGGSKPEAGLILSGNTLYGTTRGFSGSANGTVFSMNNDGSGFATLHSFTGSSTDGGTPYFSGVIRYSNALYGTTCFGGIGPAPGNGVIYSITFTPQLSIAQSGSNVVLSWPTNIAGFDYSSYTLQSTTNFFPSASWSAVSSPPAFTNGLYTVTDSISSTAMFYRLAQ